MKANQTKKKYIKQTLAHLPKLPMLTPHMPLPILLPLEPLPLPNNPRKSAIRNGAKVLFNGLVDIIDMSLDILCGLEAAAAMWTLAWMCVRFLVSA